jgi:hypothetical protein
MMRWNWPNKPRYKGQKRPSDDGRFPVFGLGQRNQARFDPHETFAMRSEYAKNVLLLAHL